MQTTTHGSHSGARFIRGTEGCLATDQVHHARYLIGQLKVCIGSTTDHVKVCVFVRPVNKDIFWELSSRAELIH
jgi:hypothetical protein